MTLYEEWMSKSFTKEGSSDPEIWNDYLPKEQKIYEYILSEKVELLKGTVAELAEQFDMPPMYICGFIDGIAGVLPAQIDLESLDVTSDVTIEIDFEKLYKKMVEYKAEHLYMLDEWNNIFSEEKRKELYTEQKNARTVVKGGKISRNDPCPCGSGKKYKKCCGVSA